MKKTQNSFTAEQQKIINAMLATFGLKSMNDEYGRFFILQVFSSYPCSTLQDKQSITDILPFLVDLFKHVNDNIPDPFTQEYIKNEILSIIKAVKDNCARLFPDDAKTIIETYIPADIVKLCDELSHAEKKTQHETRNQSKDSELTAQLDQINQMVADADRDWKSGKTIEPERFCNLFYLKYTYDQTFRSSFRSLIVEATKDIVTADKMTPP